MIVYSKLLQKNIVYDCSSPTHSTLPHFTQEEVPFLSHLSSRELDLIASIKSIFSTPTAFPLIIKNFSKK